MNNGPDPELTDELRSLQEALADVSARLLTASRHLEKVVARRTAPPLGQPQPGLDEWASPPPAAWRPPLAQWASPPAPPERPQSYPAQPGPRSLLPAPPAPQPTPPAAQQPRPHSTPAPGLAAASGVAAPPPMTGFVAGQPHPSASPHQAEPVGPSAANTVGSSWADTAGSKILGWVGAGVTVLGMVLLLVIAAQQGLVGPNLRLGMGASLGAVLLAGGLLARHRFGHHVLGATVVCTGLAAEYLVTIAAVRGVELFPAVIGHVFSGLIVVAAVAISVAWQERWLAAGAFATAGLLAPVVAGGLGTGTFVVEALLVVGGAVALILRLGFAAWIAAACPAVLLTLIALAAGLVDAPSLWVVIVMVVVAWSTMVLRWLQGWYATDPGEFEIRQPATDPAQIARDYADYHEHTAKQTRARADRAAATATLIISGIVAILAFAGARSTVVGDLSVGVAAAVVAVAFGVLAWVSGRYAALPRVPLQTSAWITAVALLGVAVLRILDGEIATVAWLLLGVVTILFVAAERARPLLTPALAFGMLTMGLAVPALDPADLLQWPGVGLVDSGRLRTRAWTTVLPAGICLIGLCAAAWWAVHRCLLLPRSGSALPDTSPAINAPRHRSTVIAWTAVCCSAVACYGMLAVVMVLVCAISPTFVGFQFGQISVTALVVVTGLVLMWQGYRSLTVRLGGLGLAAIAVAKLLLVDTGSLDPLPRALTVLTVGVFLLIGAGVFLRALSRASGHQGPPTTPAASAGSPPEPSAPR